MIMEGHFWCWQTNVYRPRPPRRAAYMWCLLVIVCRPKAMREGQAWRSLSDMHSPRLMRQVHARCHLRDTNRQRSMRSLQSMLPRRGYLLMGIVICLKHRGLSWCCLLLLDAEVAMPMRTRYGWCIHSLVYIAFRCTLFLAWRSLTFVDVAWRWPMKIEPSRCTHTMIDVRLP